jgi:hypothetical protein
VYRRPLAASFGHTVVIRMPGPPAVGHRYIKEEIMIYDKIDLEIEKIVEFPKIADIMNIYHYTRIESLKSIIENSELWASNSIFLNDKEEVFYAYNRLKNTINEKYERQRFINMLNELKQKIDFIINRMYIISFSTNKDSIPLWQEYSAGDGYNIKFDIKGIIENDTVSVIDMNEEKIIIKNVIYDKVEYNEERIDEFINNYIKIYNRIKKSDLSSDKKKMLRNKLNYYFSFKSLLIKNKTYFVEEEFRIIVIIPDPTTKNKCEKFRIARNILVPYIRIKIKRDGFISEVSTGPRNNIDIGQLSIQRFLISNGIKRVKILKSKIPWR